MTVKLPTDALREATATLQKEPDFWEGNDEEIDELRDSLRGLVNALRWQRGWPAV